MSCRPYRVNPFDGRMKKYQRSARMQARLLASLAGLEELDLLRQRQLDLVSQAKAAAGGRCRSSSASECGYPDYTDYTGVDEHLPLVSAAVEEERGAAYKHSSTAITDWLEAIEKESGTLSEIAWEPRIQPSNEHQILELFQHRLEQRRLSVDLPRSQWSSTYERRMSSGDVKTLGTCSRSSVDFTPRPHVLGSTAFGENNASAAIDVSENSGKPRKYVYQETVNTSGVRGPIASVTNVCDTPVYSHEAYGDVPVSSQRRRSLDCLLSSKNTISAHARRASVSIGCLNNVFTQPYSMSGCRTVFNFPSPMHAILLNSNKTTALNQSPPNQRESYRVDATVTANSGDYNGDIQCESRCTMELNDTEKRPAENVRDIKRYSLSREPLFSESFREGHNIFSKSTYDGSSLTAPSDHFHEDGDAAQMKEVNLRSTGNLSVNEIKSDIAADNSCFVPRQSTERLSVRSDHTTDSEYTESPESSMSISTLSSCSSNQSGRHGRSTCSFTSCECERSRDGCSEFSTYDQISPNTTLMPHTKFSHNYLEHANNSTENNLTHSIHGTSDNCRLPMRRIFQGDEQDDSTLTGTIELCPKRPPRNRHYREKAGSYCGVVGKNPEVLMVKHVQCDGTNKQHQSNNGYLERTSCSTVIYNMSQTNSDSSTTMEILAPIPPPKRKLTNQNDAHRKRKMYPEYFLSTNL